MRDAGPMREALMRRLAETERRLAALERRAVPGASPDPFDAAAHEAWWFKANTGNVLATTSGVPLNVAWATSHVFNAEGFTPRLSSAADWVVPSAASGCEHTDLIQQPLELVVQSGTLRA
jgi:hypothetical protein